MIDVAFNSIFSFTVAKKSERFSHKHSNKGSLDLEANRCTHVHKHAFSLVQTRCDKHKSFPIKHPRACVHAHISVLPLKLIIYLCYVIITTFCVVSSVIQIKHYGVTIIIM